MISRFSLISVNDNLLCAAFLNYRSCNCCVCYIVSSLHSSIIYSNNLIKSNCLSCGNSKFFYVNDITFGYFVLLSTCCNNCVHNRTSYLSLLANFGVTKVIFKEPR